MPMIRLLFRGDFLANLSRLSQKLLLKPGRLTQKKLNHFKVQVVTVHSGQVIKGGGDKMFQ